MTNSHTILITDDEQAICHILQKSLTKEGYRVLTATSGQQALALLKKEEVHLLLLDLKMPKMDGLEVLAMVRKKNNPIPVVILTAYGSLSSAREAMNLGVVEYLTKPFDLNEVRTVIKEVLGEK